jgi:hypothetical protein
MTHWESVTRPQMASLCRSDACHNLLRLRRVPPSCPARLARVAVCRSWRHPACAQRVGGWRDPRGLCAGCRRWAPPRRGQQRALLRVVRRRADCPQARAPSRSALERKAADRHHVVGGDAAIDELTPHVGHTWSFLADVRDAQGPGDDSRGVTTIAPASWRCSTRRSCGQSKGSEPASLAALVGGPVRRVAHTSARPRLRRKLLGVADPMVALASQRVAVP